MSITAVLPLRDPDDGSVQVSFTKAPANRYLSTYGDNWTDQIARIWMSFLSMIGFDSSFVLIHTGHSKELSPVAKINVDQLEKTQQIINKKSIEITKALNPRAEEPPIRKNPKQFNPLYVAAAPETDHVSSRKNTDYIEKAVTQLITQTQNLIKTYACAEWMNTDLPYTEKHFAVKALAEHRSLGIALGQLQEVQRSLRTYVAPAPVEQEPTLSERISAILTPESNFNPSLSYLN